MKFWDTSALIPLMIREPRSEEMRSILRSDAHIVTSAFTVIEVASAHWRRRHAGQLTMSAHEIAERNFAQLSETWIEVPVSQSVLDTAVSVLSRYVLRAGDALQLGAAKIAAGQERWFAFVCLDENLKAAARAEGFAVLP